MATLTVNQLKRMRRRFRKRDGVAADYTRPQINAAFQELEDYILNAKTTRPSQAWQPAVNGATSPFTFVPGRKDDLLFAWAQVKGVTG